MERDQPAVGFEQRVGKGVDPKKAQDLLDLHELAGNGQEGYQAHESKCEPVHALLDLVQFFRGLIKAVCDIRQKGAGKSDHTLLS
jgi:hypothetical protein